MPKQQLLLTLALLPLFCCFAWAEAQSNLASDAGSGVEGVILISPVQGGPTRKGSVDSRPLANTAFIVKQGDRTVVSFTTDEQGQFHISLPSGRYTVSMKDWQGAVGYYGPFTVDVAAGQFMKVRWQCDTGIR